MHNRNRVMSCEDLLSIYKCQLMCFGFPLSRSYFCKSYFRLFNKNVNLFSLIQKNNLEALNNQVLTRVRYFTIHIVSFINHSTSTFCPPFKRSLISVVCLLINQSINQCTPLNILSLHVLTRVLLYNVISRAPYN